MHAWLERLKKFADRGWYAPLVALLAAIDQFIVILPIEWLMFPGVLARPHHWFRVALWVSTGSAIGATLLAMLTHLHGESLIAHWFPSLMQSASWARSLRFVDQYGAWALLLVAFGPFPLQPAAALGGLAHMPYPKVLAAIWTGRILKYGTLAYLSTHAPALLDKVFPKPLVKSDPAPRPIDPTEPQ